MMKLIQLLPAQVVHAHCDIPCGVYSAEPAKIAALAVLKLAEKISASAQDSHDPDAHNNFVRMVMVKEREAQRCKDELLILWTDYFKMEHLEKFPELHQTFWKTAKQCSLAKRTTSVTTAQKLVEMVDEIAKMFNDTEAAAHPASK